MRKSRKFVIYGMAVVLFTSITAALDINSSQSLNYFNGNQLQFQVDTNGNIQAHGNLDLDNNMLQSFFGSTCSGGFVVSNVNDDGSFDCVNATSEVSGDFVSRTGDSMNGDLDMKGNDILDIGNLGGSNIVGSGNINSGAVGSSELAGNAVTASGGELDSSVAGSFLSLSSGALNVDSGSIGWTDLGISRSDVSASDVGLGNVRNVDLSNTAGSYLSYNTNNENYNVQAGSMGWSDLNIAQSDVNVADLGAADASLDMNGNSITNFFGSTCSGGFVVSNVNDDGSFDCVNATSEVSGDFVSRTGDSMNGNLDMAGNSINDIDWANSDNPNTDNQQLSISDHTISLDNGGSVTVPDNTIADDQNLGYSNDNAPTSDYATHTVTIDDGNGATIRDYYDPDNTIADDQNLGSSRSGDSVTISIDDGNGASFTDNYEANTDSQDLSNVVGQGGSISSGQTIDTSSGSFVLPTGSDAY